MLFTGRVYFGVCGTSTWVLGCPENFLENVGIFIYKGEMKSEKKVLVPHHYRVSSLDHTFLVHLLF